MKIVDHSTKYQISKNNRKCNCKFLQTYFFPVLKKIPVNNQSILNLEYSSKKIDFQFFLQIAKFWRFQQHFMLKLFYFLTSASMHPSPQRKKDWHEF